MEFAAVTVKQLLEAGVHFGHQTRRWNPRMKKYIFGQRNGIYLIDLEQTAKLLEEARRFVARVAASGRDVLFVGTKKQAKPLVEESAKRCGMPHVNERWLGGTLTNFETIRKSINRLHAIERMESDGTIQFYTKKEVASLKKEAEKLTRNLAGIRNMSRLPATVFVVDPNNEQIAIREAIRLKIPVVALIDTNSNPEGITYPIPGNDDAIRSIRFITSVIADSVLSGRSTYREVDVPAVEGAAGDEVEKLAGGVDSGGPAASG